MKFIYLFIFMFGGPGEPYVESRGTKCHEMKTISHWMCNKRKTMNNRFFIYVPQHEIWLFLRGFNNQTGSISEFK